MTCEEFATVGLDLASGEADSLLEKAAREHLRECPHCTALHEKWLALREDLRALGDETADAQASPRAEMRLRQEFRTKHKTFKTQRAAFVLGWSVAAAAAFLFVVTWISWHAHRTLDVANTQNPVVRTGPAKEDSLPAKQSNAAVESQSNEVLVASNNSGDFTLLPDSMPPVPEDATVVHVQMQRAALQALGLTVNEEHAGDWIQVDLLVGDDGLPQAVRLPQANTSSGN